MALWHSSFFAQVCPSHFCGQLPLQSMPSSVPFFTPSVQLGSAQNPSAHTCEGHSVPSTHGLGPASTVPLVPLELELLLAFGVPLVVLDDEDDDVAPLDALVPLEDPPSPPPEHAAEMPTTIAAKPSVPKRARERGMGVSLGAIGEFPNLHPNTLRLPRLSPKRYAFARGQGVRG
jgi:hypothetical protein